MLSFADKLQPRYCWKQIETAFLSIPLMRFSAGQRFGDTQEDGLSMARAAISDDLRRALVKLEEEASEHS